MSTACACTTRRSTLTPKEFDLLALLATDPGAMVTRRDILAEVWDPHWYGTTRTVDVHVASLRKKLGHPEWIETSRGVGFRLVDAGMSRRLLAGFLIFAAILIVLFEIPLGLSPCVQREGDGALRGAERRLLARARRQRLARSAATPVAPAR